MGLINDSLTARKNPMGFEVSGQLAYIDNQYKIVKPKNGAWELYDLTVDSEEKNNLAISKKKIRDQMVSDFTTWKAQPTVYGDTCCTIEWNATSIKSVNRGSVPIGSIDMYDLSGKKMRSFKNYQAFENREKKTQSQNLEGIYFLKSRQGSFIKKVTISNN